MPRLPLVDPGDQNARALLGRVRELAQDPPTRARSTYTAPSAPSRGARRPAAGRPLPEIAEAYEPITDGLYASLLEHFTEKQIIERCFADAPTGGSGADNP